MELYLALSCLQGRPMEEAAAELLELEPDGLQLTPGNAPTEGFEAWIAERGVATRTHHGFRFDQLRSRVWDGQHGLLGEWDSVHPPRGADDDWLGTPRSQGCLETMYPGYPLGSGRQLEAAMERGLELAVDVSHIYIQFHSGRVTPGQWSRIQAYDRVREIHVSANAGRRDTHRPIEDSTFGLGWVRDRAPDGIPVVLECYMHRLSRGERRGQLDLLRGRSR